MKLFPIEQDGSVDLGDAELHTALPNVLAATGALYERKGFVLPWIGYVAVESNVVVGTCGFAGPAVQGEAEIAYFTFPDHEGKGVATRMATALISMCEQIPESHDVSFIAHTLPEESKSTSILRKLGFVSLGGIQHPDDGEVWKWQRVTRNAEQSDARKPPVGREFES